MIKGLQPSEDAEAGQKQKHKASITGLLINLPLGIGKVLVGLIGQSQSLVADGIHSLSDTISDIVVILAVYHGGRAPDDNHPYGHGRFETLATVVVAALLLVAGVGIVVDAVSRMFEPERLGTPGWLVLVVAGLSFVLKEGLYRYTIRVARRTRSPLIAANAWHHRSDAFSSGVAVIGIGGSMMGLAYLDAVAAIIIAAMLCHVAWSHGWPAMLELADTGLDRDGRDEIRRELMKVPGVHGMRNLRTRNIGHAAFADVSVLVDPAITVTEAHRISEAVSARLVERVDALTEITVHVEPDGHADAPSALTLPLRKTVEKQLQDALTGVPGAEWISGLRLHYLDDAIDVDIELPLTDLPVDADLPDLAGRLTRTAQGVECIRNVGVLLKL